MASDRKQTAFDIFSHLSDPTYEFYDPFWGGTDAVKREMIKDTRRYFEEKYKDNSEALAFLDNLTDDELYSIAQNYTHERTGIFGGKYDAIDFAGNISSDFDEMLEASKYKPETLSYQQIYDDAVNAVNTENAEIEAMYDKLLEQQTTNFNQQMSDLNESYNDTANQILSNDYIKNRQLMDTATSELSKSRRNALEMGASAGIRLANNVNTMLSTQNQQAQQSLNTSNNLAQMMLNQRQAASGIRDNYYNTLATDTQNRINLKQGTAGKISDYANSQFNTQQKIYDQQYGAWENKYGSLNRNNAFWDYQNNYSANKK